MTGKASAGRRNKQMTSFGPPNAPLDVTIVLLDDGYASTAIGPIEVFHSAGVLWNWLHGEPQQPRFRVRVASIDGRAVTSLGALGLTPACAIGDIEQTDIIIAAASGRNVQEQIARGTSLLPLPQMAFRGAYIGRLHRRRVRRMRLLGRPAGDHPRGVANIPRALSEGSLVPEQFVTEIQAFVQRGV